MNIIKGIQKRMENWRAEQVRKEEEHKQAIKRENLNFEKDMLREQVYNLKTINRIQNSSEKEIDLYGQFARDVFVFVANNTDGNETEFNEYGLNYKLRVVDDENNPKLKVIFNNKEHTIKLHKAKSYVNAGTGIMNHYINDNEDTINLFFTEII